MALDRCPHIPFGKGARECASPARLRAIRPEPERKQRDASRKAQVRRGFAGSRRGTTRSRSDLGGGRMKRPERGVEVRTGVDVQITRMTSV